MRAHRLNAVDSFKPSSKMKSHLRLEVDFLPFYAQNERNLSEIDLSEMVRGVRFEPTNLTASPPLLGQVLAVNLNVVLDLTPSAKVTQF